MDWFREEWDKLTEDQKIQLYNDAKALAPMRRRRPRRLSEIKKHGSWLHFCGAACSYNFVDPIVPDESWDLTDGAFSLFEAIIVLLDTKKLTSFPIRSIGLPGFTVFLEPWQRAELLHDIDDCCLAIENGALFN